MTEQKKITLQELPARSFVQGSEPAVRNRSWNRGILSVGGWQYQEGIGLFCCDAGSLSIHAPGKAISLTLLAGVDDFVSSESGVFFRILELPSGRELAVSSIMYQHESAMEWSCDLTGVNDFRLEYRTGQPNNEQALDLLKFELVYTGEAPYVYDDLQTCFTKNVHWLFPKSFPQEREAVQHGLRLKKDGFPSGVSSALIRTFPPRMADFDYYNLPFNCRVTGIDGTVSAEFYNNTMRKKTVDGNITDYTISGRDPQTQLCFGVQIRTYADEDMFSVRTLFRNESLNKLFLLERDAVNILLIPEGTPYLRTFRGSQNAEMTRVEDIPLPHGTVQNQHTALSHNAQEIFPGCYIGLDGEIWENSGTVFAAALGWDGNWRMNITRTEKEEILFSAGAFPENIVLHPGESYLSPEVLFTMSGEGAGQASRNFHKYMLRYGLAGGRDIRPVVLNSWEGCYFDFSMAKILELIRSAAKIGVELFVLDDGWFGNDEYARNDGTAGLGDWLFNRKKLPGGLQPLINEAKKCGIGFGLWIEPEMVNTKSLLYKKHPEWVIAIPGREIRPGRGQTQLMLDLAREDVAEYVYNTVANLLTAFPEIEYIKWDHNMRGGNQGSAFLGQMQGALSDRHNRAFEDIMERLQKKFPAVSFQLCASGGGRCNTGLMKFFCEFWCSDNSQGTTRILTQWAYSHFFPAKTMASHISRRSDFPTSYKFRTDVAMSGRLGVELCPDHLSEVERETIRQGIAVYKELRSIIHGGELFRGRIPGVNSVSELTYVSENKEHALLFGFRVNAAQPEPAMVFPTGLELNAMYRMQERNIGNARQIQCCICSGAELMRRGINVNFSDKVSSVIIEFRVVSNST